ncbi:MAG TPA: hypothetical protein ENF51_00205, partial [Candidatus Aenigmarchaeota archaeon]|nr:hypothetical protein [Candidatus Aenigmarchaeota archaeon]
MALDVYLVGAVHEGEPSREMVRTIVRLAKEKGLPVGLESHPKIWEITPSLDKGYWKKLEKVLKENEVRVEYLGSPETLRRVAKRLGKTPQEITCVPLFQYLVAELTGDLEVLLRTHMRAGEFYLHVLEQEKAILEKVAEREENLILVMGRAHTDYLAVVKCKEVKGKELRFEYVGREVEKEVTYLQDLLEYEPPPHL